MHSALAGWILLAVVIARRVLDAPIWTSLIAGVLVVGGFTWVSRRWLRGHWVILGSALMAVLAGSLMIAVLILMERDPTNPLVQWWVTHPELSRPLGYLSAAGTVVWFFAYWRLGERLRKDVESALSGDR